MIWIMNAGKIAGLTGVLLFSLSLRVAYPQDNLPSDKDGSIVAGNDVWYAQPWIWVIIIALLVIFIIYYTKRNKRKSLKNSAEKGPR